MPARVRDFRVDSWEAPHVPDWVSFEFHARDGVDFEEALREVKRVHASERSYDPDTQRWAVKVSRNRELMEETFPNFAGCVRAACDQMSLFEVM